MMYIIGDVFQASAGGRTTRPVATPSADQVIKEIGRRIAELRAEKGWSQARFAEVLGIALQNLQRMEQGRQNFTVRTLVNVARKLDCAPRDLWKPMTTTQPKRGRPSRKRVRTKSG
jgi:transcriptional regulator with XRE-family HTH domain